SSRENHKRDQVKVSVSNELEPYALELLEVLMKAAKAVQETSDEL
ncbi:MAG: chorismate mutase, partial [Atopobium sp.]|nr:chorismate mutase [Atopobium sp.]